MTRVANFAQHERNLSHILNAQVSSPQVLCHS